MLHCINPFVTGTHMQFSDPTMAYVVASCTIVYKTAHSQCPFVNLRMHMYRVSMSSAKVMLRKKNMHVSTD